MTIVKAIAAVSICCIFFFQDPFAQSTQTTIIEQRNARLIDTIDAKAAIVLRNARADSMHTPVVIYRTKYVRPVGVVSTNCDTVYYVIKKKPLLKRLFTRHTTDTIRVGQTTNDY